VTLATVLRFIIKPCNIWTPMTRVVNAQYDDTDRQKGLNASQSETTFFFPSFFCIVKKNNLENMSKIICKEKIGINKLAEIYE
jgi:hypothetical protein